MSNNYYSDHVKTVQIGAVIENGQLVDSASGNYIELPEGTPVIMIVPRERLSKSQKEQFKTLKRELLPAGSKLMFDLPKVHLEVYLQTLDPVVFKSSGNKIPQVEECPCVITNIFDKRSNLKVDDFEPIEVDSLNQAFYQTSIKYRPKARSHTTNIYKSYKMLEPFGGKSLDSIRSKFWDVEE